MILNFVCRAVTVEDILKCSFGLNKTEIALLKYLIREKTELTVEEIQKEIKKDRTTIQRAVKKLYHQDLIIRRQINNSSGGYYFIYSPKPKAFIKERVYSQFESFKEAMGQSIQKW